MSLLGLHLNLLIGPTVPVPAPPPLMEALDKVEVQHGDGDYSGFEISFRVSKGLGGLFAQGLTMSPQLQAGSRLIVSVLVGVRPQVLIDGIVTEQELQPGDQPGASVLKLKGHDVSWAMDREEKNEQHPAQSEMVIALKLIALYARFGLIPIVIPPFSFDVPVPTDRIPQQNTTDLKYLRELAARFGYVFSILPGPLPFTNRAYWGPPRWLSPPLSALSVDMGPATNVDNVSFTLAADEAKTIDGKVQDRLTNQQVPIKTFASLRPPLALSPALFNRAVAGRQVYRPGGAKTVPQAMAEAQGETDKSIEVVTAKGTLDTARYGGVLEIQRLVGMRGVGLAYDGFYYLKSVKHVLARNSYKQEFSAVREGTISTVPAVPVFGGL